MCWFLYNTFRDYKYKLISYNGKPFYINEAFEVEFDRYDRIIYGLEVNQHLSNIAKQNNTSVTFMNKLLYDYIDSWLFNKKGCYDEWIISDLIRSVLYICGFYLKTKPTLDFQITAALNGFEAEIARLEGSKQERMNEFELPEAFYTHYCDMFSMMEKDNRGTLINFTMRNNKFDFNEHTKSLIFHYMLSNEFYNLCWEPHYQFEEFTWLLYDVMKMLDVFSENEVKMKFGIGYQFRGLESRISSIDEDEMDLIDAYLLEAWRAYYNLKEEVVH